MKKPASLRSSHQRTKAEVDRDFEKTRPSSSERGYDARWRKSRLVHLAAHPLCVMCEAEGRIESATVVDHIIPHRGDPVLFWDAANWQSLCGFHHNRDKHSEEMRGGL